MEKFCQISSKNDESVWSDTGFSKGGTAAGGFHWGLLIFQWQVLCVCVCAFFWVGPREQKQNPPESYKAIHECLPKAFHKKKGLLSFYAEKKFFQKPLVSADTNPRVSKSVPRGRGGVNENTISLTERNNTIMHDWNLTSLKISGEKPDRKRTNQGRLEGVLRGMIMMRSKELAVSTSQKKKSPG